LGSSEGEKSVNSEGEDLLSLLNDDPEGDADYFHIVVLHLADGDLRTYSFPLRACSEAFRAMLRCEPKQIYSFPEMTVKTGQELLYFLYNDRLKEDADVRELLVLADKFLIWLLKDACVSILKRILIDDDNWKEFFQFGDLCNVEELKLLGLKHFKQFVGRIMKKLGWNEHLSKADLATLLKSSSEC